MGETRPHKSAEDIHREARRLWNEQRFWEVHEVLEELWKTSVDPDKRWVQGLILAAAALVHAQKQEIRIVFPMLGRSLERVQGIPETYHGWELVPFRAALERMMETQTPHFPTV